MAGGLRPPDRDPEDHEPGGSRKGWQHEASSRVEQDFRESLFTRMPPSDRALVRSQSGPGAGVAFSASPSSMLTRIEAPLFRVLVQRRLRLPLPLFQRICGCGLSIDPLGHHRAACSRTGALGRRGFALESALARVCREAGGRVATNLFVRNMDLGVPRAGDNRRLEVVVDGLPLFGGAQLAVDTTLVSALKANGEPGEVLQTGTEWLWQRRVASKRERTPNCLIRAAGHVLWCLLLRLAGDGRTRPRSSSVCWRGHVSDPNPGCFKDVWSKRGG